MPVSLEQKKQKCGEKDLMPPEKWRKETALREQGSKAKGTEKPREVIVTPAPSG